MGPAGLRELSSSDLRRRSASLEIALQRRVSVGQHSGPFLWIWHQVASGAPCWSV